MKLESENTPETDATPELVDALLRDAERRGAWLVLKDAADGARFVQAEESGDGFAIEWRAGADAPLRRASRTFPPDEARAAFRAFLAGDTDWTARYDWTDAAGAPTAGASVTRKGVLVFLAALAALAAWLLGVFLGLLLFATDSAFAVLPVDSFTGVLTGIKDLDAFALGRCTAAIALVAAFVLLWRLFRRPNADSLAKFFVTLAVGAFYSAATLAYLPEIGPLNLLMGGSSTVYGKGFGRSGFKKIRPGMTKAEVAALVGEGVDINAMGLEIDRERHDSDQVACWFLSGPGNSQNYWQYGVEFTTNGVVDHTWCHFWYD